jgi:hypothetical protein
MFRSVDSGVLRAASHHDMAAKNKSLARSNKSCTGTKATKKHAIRQPGLVDCRRVAEGILPEQRRFRGIA